MVHQVDIKTSSHSQMVSITRKIQDLVPENFNGICHVFCRHTTAGLTINENADPDVVTDMLGELERIVPWSNPDFRHFEGNSAAHVKATLTGFSLTIPVESGKMLLGTWQGIYFCEFDGPRPRHVLVSFTA